MVFAGGPVLAEVVEEIIPGIELVLLEVAQRKRKAVVDSGNECDLQAGLLDNPFSDFLAAPVPVVLTAEQK
jgi:hypothetical protein